MVKPAGVRPHLPSRLHATAARPSRPVRNPDPRHSELSVKLVSERVAQAASALLLSSALLLAPPVDAKTRLAADEQRVVELFSKNTASVVNITNLSSRRDAFTTDMQEYPQGAGSGIVWDTKGHIVVRSPSVPGHAAS